MKTKKLLFITLIFVCFGCSKNPMDEIIPGQTTIHEAIEHLGEPTQVKTSSFNPNDEMYIFKDGTLQVEKKQVKVVFSKPFHEKEHNLQYWRQKNAAFVSIENPLRAPSGLGQYEIKYPQLGVALIFDGNTEKVIKVIKYEPHK